MTYGRILRRFRNRIRNRDYVITIHAEEEMSADGYSIFDVEHGVLTGQILERQEDETTGESKYRLRGDTASEKRIELVAKLGPAGKMVIITVYAP